jgi:hypothetical protein
VKQKFYFYGIQNIIKRLFLSISNSTEDGQLGKAKLPPSSSKTNFKTENMKKEAFETIEE